MEKSIHGKISGYVIRSPGEEGEMRYAYGNDPAELMAKYYEGFNPVFALVRLDAGRIIELSNPAPPAQRSEE